MGNKARLSLLVALLSLLAGWLLLHPGGQAVFTAVDDATQFLIPLGILLVSLWWSRGALRRLSPSRRWAILLLATGLMGNILGQMIWTYLECIAHQQPFPSWADAAHLSSYPLYLAGILLLPGARLHSVTRTRVALDGTMIMLGVWTIGWYFIVGPTILQGGDSLLAKVVSAAYPVLDLVSLSWLILLAMRRHDRRVLVGMTLFALGLLGGALVDGVYDVLELHGAYFTGTLLDIGWPLKDGLVAVAVGALAMGWVSAAAEAGAHDIARPPRIWQVLLPYLTIPLLAALSIYAFLGKVDPTVQWGVYIGTIALVILVIARQVTAVRETVAYAARLHALLTDNDALNHANRQLEVLATTDALTGLANRTLLRRHIDDCLDASRLTGSAASLLLLDLDRFKDVNDTLGHRAGDVLLQQVAHRLRERTRASDAIARLGGDEFAAILPQTDVDGASVVATALVAAIEEPFIVEGQALSVGVSIGIASYPTHGEDSGTLLQHADVAMYEAKRNNVDYSIYDATLDGHDAERLAMTADLRTAIGAGELTLFYQPKMNILSGKITGVEALIRWRHPSQGLIPPDRFIPLAEQTGLIVPMTNWVLHTALAQAKAWAETGLVFDISVNLSLRNLRDPQLVDTVATLLSEYKVPAHYLCLELTESVIMADVEGTQSVLHELTALGVHISIDDFGTGYSSLAYLSSLPVDELKIDRSFVRRLASTQNDATIVASTIGLGHSLGLNVVTEGVEDAETLGILGNLGSDAVQGYFLSKPLPADEIEKWLLEWTALDQRRAG